MRKLDILKMNLWFMEGMEWVVLNAKTRLLKLHSQEGQLFFVLNVKNKIINNIASVFFGAIQHFWVKIHKWT